MHPRVPQSDICYRVLLIGHVSHYTAHRHVGDQCQAGTPVVRSDPALLQYLNEESFRQRYMNLHQPGGAEAASEHAHPFRPTTSGSNYYANRFEESYSPLLHLQRILERRNLRASAAVHGRTGALSRAEARGRLVRG